MRITKKIRAVREETTDIVCDCCGKSCWDSHKMNYEFAQLGAHWGFYSRKDTLRWDCDLCEDCADKVKEFIEGLGGKIRAEHYL